MQRRKSFQFHLMAGRRGTDRGCMASTSLTISYTQQCFLLGVNLHRNAKLQLYLYIYIYIIYIRIYIIYIRIIYLCKYCARPPNTLQTASQSVRQFGHSYCRGSIQKPPKCWSDTSAFRLQESLEFIIYKVLQTRAKKIMLCCWCGTVK